MKINEAKLQALYDGLRLLMLLSTDEHPFDMVPEVARNVKWLSMLRLPAALKGAVGWLEKQPKKQGYKFKGHDGPELPEQAWKVWDGYFTEFSSTVKYERKRQRKLAANRGRKKAKPATPQAAAPGLFEKFPWIAPTQGEGHDGV